MGYFCIPKDQTPSGRLRNAKENIDLLLKTGLDMKGYLYLIDSFILPDVLAARDALTDDKEKTD